MSRDEARVTAGRRGQRRAMPPTANTPATEVQGARSAPSAPFLPEIQALRALAVLAVLVYHLVPRLLPGGYVGVDVFFVISGFLITGHLLRELDRHGHVRLAVFWARRAKRLLPAALLVLAVTAVAVVVFAPRVLWPQHLGEVLAATFYVENWRLAADSVDYLAAANHPSPVQHYWSLSVEEQFYIALPLLVLLGSVISRRWNVGRRAVILAMLAVVAVVSLLHSVTLTASSPAVAYVSTATRGWEFAAGGLLAFAPRRGSVAVRTVVACAGVTAVAWSMWSFSDQTPFPGAAALWPVLGTAAVIWAGQLPWRLSPSGLGAWWPVATLGRTSYAMYLWHWPLVVLLPLATGVRLRATDVVLVLVVTLVLAYATTVWVEDPVRFSPRLLGPGRRARTVGLRSLAGMASVAVLASTVVLVSRSALEDARVELVAARAGDVTCLGAAAGDCAEPEGGRALVPHPVLAPEDGAGGHGCWAGNDEHELRLCSFGPEQGYERRVLALGDSHNNMLVPAYEHVATSHGWRVDVAGHANCYWTRASTHNPVRAFREACADWRAAVDEHLASAAPYDAILVVASRDAHLVPDEAGEPDTEATVQGILEAWAGPLSRGVPVIVIADVPEPRRDVVECVVRHEEQAGERCGTPRQDAFAKTDLVLQAASVAGAPVVDLTDLMCSSTSCHAVVGHVVVWRDRGHVTGTFARTLGPALGDRLAELDPS